MKKLILLICFGIICSIAGNTYSWTTLYIPESLPMKPYQALLEAQGTVESSGDNYALNPSEQAYGKLQIRQIRLDDYYERTGIRYNLIDCYDDKISESIWYYYAMKFHPSDYKHIAMAWNGSGYQTKIYWRKTKKQLSKNN